MYLLNLREDNPPVSDLLGFTFHYVSIKSAHESSKRGGLVQFTFHYVSIKSF